MTIKLIPEHRKEVRKLTKRDFALGALSVPSYRGDYSVRRSLKQGEVIEFRVFNRKSDFNWEFCVNNDHNIRLWFSQLNNFYLTFEGHGVYSCILKLKDGDKIFISHISSPDEFWQNVQGRKFQVEVWCTDFYAVDKWHWKCEGVPVKDIIAYIFRALDAGRYDDVKGMTKLMPLYVFTEV